ncbi:MAG: PDZ domain-containing protein [Opitutaceae bacterium]|nr:PDZ domain-containing protein [Opitutaceae bacterium]
MDTISHGWSLPLCALLLSGCGGALREASSETRTVTPLGSTEATQPARTPPASRTLGSANGEIVTIKLVDPAAPAGTTAERVDEPAAANEPVHGSSGQPAPVDPSVVVLDPIQVSGRTYLSFDFSLALVRSGSQIAWATVTAVKPNSEASAAGLTPMTRILAINGKEIQDFEASLSHGSELHALLINRKPRARITLDVLLNGYGERRTLTLIKRRSTPWPASIESLDTP